MKNEPKNSPLPYDAQDDDELLDDLYSVASMTECTGLIPAGQVDEAEADSYEEIYDVPLGTDKRYEKWSTRDAKNSAPDEGR